MKNKLFGIRRRYKYHSADLGWDNDIHVRYEMQAPWNAYVVWGSSFTSRFLFLLLFLFCFFNFNFLRLVGLTWCFHFLLSMDLER